MNKPSVSVMLLTGLLLCSGKTDALGSLVDTTNHKLAIDLFKMFPQAKENYGISPFLTQVSLAMAGEGARGITQYEIYKLLYQPDVDKEAMRLAYRDKMLSLHKEVQSLRLSIRIFLDNIGEVNTDYRLTTHKYFWSDVVTVDFKIPQKATSVINQWVSNATDNGIDVLFVPDSLPSGTKLILANAMHFKDTWESEFPLEIVNQPFNANRNGYNTIEPTAMMGLLNTRLRNKFSYKLGVQILELPYKNPKFKMILLLPKDLYGLGNVLSEMSTSNLFAEIDSLETSNIDIYIPMFKLISSITIDKMGGMPTSFSKDADFSGITSTPIEISKYIIKTGFEMRPDGTSAAAVAKEAEDEYYRPTFLANHPFAYLLFHEQTILLQGIITHPQQ